MMKSESFNLHSVYDECKILLVSAALPDFFFFSV